MFLHI